MKRAWDIIVGLTMVVCGLFLQAIFCGALTMAFVSLVLEKLMPSEFQTWSGVGVFLLLMLLVNLIAAYQFWRQRITQDATDEAGALLLVPRGLQRIIRGTEEPDHQPITVIQRKSPRHASHGQGIGYLTERAQGASREKVQGILARSPDASPLPGDEIEP